MATPLPLPATSVGHASSGILQPPKPMPHNISLKKQKNLIAQHMAAATAALAVSSGLTSDMATSLGTMAADCVAKNYGNKQQE